MLGELLSSKLGAVDRGGEVVLGEGLDGEVLDSGDERSIDLLVGGDGG